jgi:hypothetical protein
VSFVSITLYVASQRDFFLFCFGFVDLIQKLLDTPSYDRVLRIIFVLRTALKPT